jgi:formamidopyrimidine-DNA glycosylase
VFRFQGRTHVNRHISWDGRREISQRDLTEICLKKIVMPELPDLVVFSENLQARLQGRTVHSVECHRALPLNTSPEQLRNSLCNTSMASVRRAGKEIAFVFSNQATLFVHLMLQGKFSITPDPGGVRSRMLTLGLGDESLVVRDHKGQVTIKLNPSPSSVPDALEVDGTYLRRKISERRRTGVKAFLIDQSILRGIGNAYVDEILWQAKISPKSVVGRIPDHIVDDLVASIRSVLIDAIENIKREKPETISDEVRGFLRVHNPDRSESPTGHRIMTERVASRITYFTEEQVLYV